MTRVETIESNPKFSISDQGIVYGPRGILKPRLRKATGYYAVILSAPRKSHYIHRLVGINFIPNPENKPEINHKDGDKSNNYYKNLEWATHSENELHSYRVLGKEPSYGKSSLCIKLKAVKGNLVHEYESFNEATRVTGISRSKIKRSINKSMKDMDGFRWYKT